MPRPVSCWARYCEFVSRISPSSSSVPTAMISAFTGEPLRRAARFEPGAASPGRLGVARSYPVGADFRQHQPLRFGPDEARCEGLLPRLVSWMSRPDEHHVARRPDRGGHDHERLSPGSYFV